MARFPPFLLTLQHFVGVGKCIFGCRWFKGLQQRRMEGALLICDSSIALNTRIQVFLFGRDEHVDQVFGANCLLSF